MRAKRVVLCMLVLAMAVPVLAAPAPGDEAPAGWWARFVEGWGEVVRVFAGSEPAEEPKPTAAEPEGREDVLTCDPVVGCAEVGPHIDPDG